MPVSILISYQRMLSISSKSYTYVVYLIWYCSLFFWGHPNLQLFIVFHFQKVLAIRESIEFHHHQQTIALLTVPHSRICSLSLQAQFSVERYFWWSFSLCWRLIYGWGIRPHQLLRSSFQIPYADAVDDN